MSDKTEDKNKSPEPVKATESKFDPMFKYFRMTPIKPGEQPPITKEEMYDQLVKQMTNMDEEGIKNIANIIVNLVKEIEDLSDQIKSKTD